MFTISEDALGSHLCDTTAGVLCVSDVTWRYVTGVIALVLGMLFDLIDSDRAPEKSSTNQRYSSRPQGSVRGY